jgi:hypothetical protein
MEVDALRKHMDEILYRGYDVAAKITYFMTKGRRSQYKVFIRKAAGRAKNKIKLLRPFRIGIEGMWGDFMHWENGLTSKCC